MHLFDIRTLLLVITLAMICRAAILGYVWQVERQYTPIRYWAVGSTAIAIGALLVGLRGIAPDMLSVWVAQALIIFGWLTLSGGTVLAAEQTPPWRAGIALALAGVAGVAWYLWVTPDIAGRTVVITLPLLLFDGYAAWACMQAQGSKHANTLHWLGGLLLIQMASNVWKMVVFVQAGNNPLTWDSASTAQFYLMALASIILGTVLFVLLAAQKIQEALDLEIQERTEREKSLRLAALVFENSTESMMVTDADGNILNVNPAFTTLTGFTAAEAIGQTPRILNCNRQGSAFYVGMWHNLLTTGTWQGELWNQRKNGEPFAARMTINSIHRPDGTTESRVGLFHDITAQKQAEEVIQHQAHFDALTGLPNRYFFFDQLSKEFSRARRSGGRVGLLFMDLNKFKPVNDQYGHDAGDQVLKTVAERWLASIRRSDTLVRLGGDEFALIIDRLSDADELATIASKLIAALTEPIALPRGAHCTVGASVGGSIYPDSATEMDSLVAAADAAMYACKAAGGGHYQLTPNQSATAQAEADWVVFDNSHLVGIAAIDAQHRKLVQMVNQINRAVRDNCPEQALKEHLVALIAFTRVHFDTEHAFMQAHGYPGQDTHDRQHDGLLRQAEQLVERLQPGDELTLLQTLKDWLVAHILNADKPLGAYLVAKGLS